MQVIRTIAWVVVTAILVAFIAMNWNRAPVNFWPLENGNYIHFDWPVGFVALLFFGLGMLPVWLYLRAVRWRLNRRIASLENSLRANSTAALAMPATVPVTTPAAVPETDPAITSENPSEPLKP
ncbi:MAG TPA: LapA family protein [Novosphingobium sp.]|nr:LapA family protein [Novosphingobium sp.]